jgi:23S rRNA (cytosine1962-C5)-methyltransferase
MKRLYLKEKEERRLLRGHLWAYRNELAEPPKAEDGEVVDLYAPQGKFVARGFYQAQGGIAVRILTHHQQDISEELFARRIEEAGRFRKEVFPGETVYRWVFGESDGLPGFVADRYDTVIAANSPCAFYKTAREQLAKAFLAQPGIAGFRLTVGNETFTYGDAPEAVQCTLNGYNLRVDLAGGQKTGLFLDQRNNWKAIQAYANGASVLDGHCYVGMWSLHAGSAGAQSVLGVDTSEPAIERAKENAAANNLADRCAFERADVLDVLNRGANYDLIVLDPPSLAKSRAQEKHALALHQRMNRAALMALNPGGILATSSCSHFVSREDFLEIIKRAAVSAQRRAWILEVRGPAPDHPVLVGMPETGYLNCVILRAL